ncbi:hypothetical protein E1B28_005071 [Marasmius oreades]|uniref:Uncharacterized protein n=1 Tax=Marasmius oreades TaxID=181124 RepID=A0A9P7UZV3_9AGAR|nr:uncharacterized protein E1B28_005071 [Marasmius oreades]KAG7097750.1 hypothetical protein E1B28_005071 [Marasmius oreades]
MSVRYNLRSGGVAQTAPTAVNNTSSSGQLDSNGESFVTIPSASRAPTPGVRTPGNTVSNDDRGVPSLQVEHEAAHVEQDLGTGISTHGQRLGDLPDDERVNNDSRSWNTVPTRRRSRSMDESNLSSRYHARSEIKNRFALTEEQLSAVRQAEASMSDND